MSNIEKPYAARPAGSDGRPHVTGPGDGFGYDAGTLWPQLRFSTAIDAAAAAELCNTAYAVGYRQAQRDIRKALGVEAR